MLICIDKNRITPFKKMQKSISIDNILEDIVFYDDENKAEEDGYKPISVSTIIRSTYSNLVVAHTYENIERYYITLTDIPNPVPFKGYDLFTYLTSLAVSMAYNPSNPLSQNLMVSAKMIPLGLCYLDSEIGNPYFCSQIIIHDDYVKQMENLLEKGFKVIPIKDINPIGNLKVIVDEIFEINEGKD